jgi:hypothetical protein
VQKLLRHGADPLICTADFMYPFDLAHKNGYNDVENLIKRYISACKIDELKRNEENPAELLVYLKKKFADKDTDLNELLERNPECANEKEKYERNFSDLLSFIRCFSNKTKAK